MILIFHLCSFVCLGTCSEEFSQFVSVSAKTDHDGWENVRENGGPKPLVESLTQRTGGAKTASHSAWSLL